MPEKVMTVTMICIVAIVGLFACLDTTWAGKQFSRNMQAIQGR